MNKDTASETIPSGGQATPGGDCQPVDDSAISTVTPDMTLKMKDGGNFRSLTTAGSWSPQARTPNTNNELTVTKAETYNSPPKDVRCVEQIDLTDDDDVFKTPLEARILIDDERAIEDIRETPKNRRPAKKRKNVESPEEPIATLPSATVSDKLIKKLKGKISELVQYGKNNSNVHKEVKRLAGELMGVMRSIEQKTWIVERKCQSEMEETIDELKQRLQLINDEKMESESEVARSNKELGEKERTILEQKQMIEALHMRMRDMQDKNLKENTTRKVCERCKGTGEEVEEIREINFQTLDEWQAAEKQKWDESLYRNTEVIVSNPVDTKDLVTKVVFVEPEDAEMRHSIQKLYKDRYPELGEVNEDFAIIELTTRVRTNKESEPTRKKIIKAKYDGTDIGIWEKLNKIKKETENEESVAMHHLGCMSLERFRKMTEAVFHGTATKAVIYTTNTKKAARQTSITNATKPRQTYAIVVEKNGNDYKTLLNKIKTTIQKEDAKKAIKKIRSTKEGKLLITLEKDDVALDQIQKAINIEGIKTRKLVDDKETETLHLRGMDALTEPEDVKMAIESRIGSLTNKEYKISDIRPNFNDTTAVTITIGKEDADRVVEGGKLRVGLVECSIEKKIKMSRCFKCWAYDHQSANCKGEDRSKLCHNCGEEGHKKSDCKSEEKCPICNEKGHKAGTGKCKEFRRALSSEKRRIRKASHSSQH